VLEPDDFEAMYRREWTPVFRLALALTNDWDDAWDIGQDTFRRIWERRETLDWSRPIRPLLLVTARRLATDRFRQARRRLTVRIGLTEPIGHLDAESSVRWLDLAASLKRLLPSERAAIVLVGVIGCSYREAAEVLGLGEGALRALMSRARRKLAADE
jgi:RNA polymerase sigma-70 factor (ECF subfamily)